MPARIARLSAIAARLNPKLPAPWPSLWLFTDPDRLPDPMAAAARLPPGAGVVFRHFGAADRFDTARRLARLCARRRLVLLIAADPALARAVGAAGVHWPEKMVRGKYFRAAGLQTAAAHSLKALRRARAVGAGAVFLSPVFPSRSPSATRVLGLRRASRMAANGGAPVFALGGVTERTALRLRGLKFSGVAAVEAFASDQNRNAD